MSKKALVTGGTRGIGKAIAELLVKKGYAVTVTGSKPEGKGPTGAVYLPCDFSDSKVTETFAQKASRQGFSILVNNAGINKVGLVSDYALSDFQAIQQVNITAPFLLCRALSSGMKERGYGRILNITSIFGVVSKAGRAAYSASKFGLFGLTRALALELAKDNVLVNCLAPGFVDTELTRGILGEKGIQDMVAKVPVGRLGTPEEIARYACFLVGEENTFMTGQNVIVDGGYTCE